MVSLANPNDIVLSSAAVRFYWQTLHFVNYTAGNVDTVSGYYGDSLDLRRDTLLIIECLF